MPSLRNAVQSLVREATDPLADPASVKAAIRRAATEQNVAIRTIVIELGDAIQADRA